jgi:hypothetical protein
VASRTQRGRRGLWEWLDRHDPTRYAVHRGVRAAIAVSVALPVSRLLVPDPQFTLFAAFGSLALLIFVDFPGNRNARATSYLLLGFVGMVLITLGTLASRTGWIAVSSMAVVGFLILFAGVLSAAMAAAGRAALLAFVLPVTVPADVGEIPIRLGGWGLGMLIAIPLALFVWPPKEHDDLRVGVGAACRAIAPIVATSASTPAQREAASTAMDTLHRTFRASVSRPVGLSAGGRLLARVTRDLEWLWVEVRGATASAQRAHDTGPHRPGGLDPGERGGHFAEGVMEHSAAALTSASAALHTPSQENRNRLSAALDALTATRTETLGRWLDAALSDRAPADLSVVERLHSVGYATELVGRHVAGALAADARRSIDKILGRHGAFVMPGPVPGSVQASTLIARHHLSWQSVWLHNSLRGGLGLALAVLLAQVTEVSHGFWVALGAMSVLRSSALNTGATAFRALAGTVVGVVAGAGALILLEGSPLAWVVLPFAMFLAGFANDAISFAAGQAAFSLAVLIMFSLLGPAGWEVGLVRLEDVAIGAGAGLAMGLLLWPRGAGGAIRRAMADVFRGNARLLANAVDRLTREPSPTEVDAVDVLGASYRMDDALRQYLADRGAKTGEIEDLVAVCVGAERVRLTSEALFLLADRVDHDGTTPVPTDLAQDLRRRADRQSHWLQTVADELTDDVTGIADPPPADAVAVALSDARRTPGDADALRAEPTGVWMAIHLDDLVRHENRLRPHAVALGTPPQQGELQSTPA